MYNKGNVCFFTNTLEIARKILNILVLTTLSVFVIKIVNFLSVTVTMFIPEMRDISIIKNQMLRKILIKGPGFKEY